MNDYVGPVECVEIAAANAGITLTRDQLVLMAEALVDMGADFNS